MAIHIESREGLGGKIPYTMTYLEVDREPFSYPLHTHRGLCDLTYVRSGSLRQTLNGESRRFRAGRFLWIRESDRHSLFAEECRFYNANVPESLLFNLAESLTGDRCPYARSGPGPLGVNIPPHRQEEFSRSLDSLFLNQRKPGSRIGFNRFWINFYADYLSGPAQGEDGMARDVPRWLKRGLELCEERLERGIGLPELCGLCGRSREHVSRSFRKYLDESPSAYLNRLRLERAALLLSSGNREILDICYQLGFSSLSYFYRLFKDKYAMPPGEYRQKRFRH